MFYSPALMKDIPVGAVTFILMLLLCWLKINQCCSVVCITDSAAQQTGWALGLCASLSAHREAMDWFVSLDRLFKNTPSCDAQRGALEAEIQPRLLLYKWSELHWFKVYTINAINAGFRRVATWMSISHRLSCHTVTISSCLVNDDISVCESLRLS